MSDNRSMIIMYMDVSEVFRVKPDKNAPNQKKHKSVNVSNVIFDHLGLKLEELELVESDFLFFSSGPKKL